IHVAPGVGAVVTQASTNPRLGHLGLNLMRAGYSAPRALQEIAASDQFVERRQLGCLDMTGLTAARTGAENKPWAGHRADRNVVVAANAVVSKDVADAMFDVFQRSADLALWERLLRSLEAGKAAGGQPNGEGSRGLYVVDREPYPVGGLRPPAPTPRSPPGSTSSPASRTRWSTCGSICIRSPSPSFAGSPTPTSPRRPTTICGPATPSCS